MLRLVVNPVAGSRNLPIIGTIFRRGALEFCQFDEAYLRGLREGDRSVEEHFASYFGELIHIKLRRRLSARDAIDDICQETLKRVFKIIQSERGVRQPEALGALVVSVCNKVFLEAVRKRQREGVVVEESDRPSLMRSPLETLIADERSRAVRAVLDELPERDRHLLTAVFLDDADRDALCEELDVSRDYLRVLLHRAVEKFRDRCATKRTSFPQSHDRMGAGRA
jgi:RNA polymerase sigma-70 factor (ECF subfamily)